MKKLLLTLVALFSATVFAMAGKVDFTTQNISVTDDGFTLSAGGYTFTAVKNDGATKPTQNGKTFDIRLYAKNTMTVSAGTGTMTKMVFAISAAGQKRLTDIAASTGSVAIDASAWTVTWTGSASEVTFTVGEKATYGTDGDTKAGQFDIDNVDITGEGTGGSTGGDTGGDVTPVEGAITVAEAQAAAADTQVTVQGTVYAVGASSFVVGDKTGYIFHYGAADVKVGDNVTVSGAVSSYGGFNQFKSAQVTVNGSGTASYPTPTVLTGADMDAWIAEPEIDYVQYTGKLTISGNYYNVTVEGASTAVGSIIKPSEALAAKMSNGNEYTFTGFAMYVSGTKYLNTALVDVKAAGEEVKLNDISNTLETAYTPEKCVELINDEKNDLSKQVYIKGKISQMPEGAISTSYGNATFYISSDGSESAQQFEIFRGYWFKGEKFTAEDQLKLGDEVVYYGSMTKYNETYETNAGATLVLLNGKDSADSGETPAEPESIANTAETAYTVAEAIAIINKENVDLTEEVYVKGIISKVESFNEKYGSITYWISEDGSETAQQFEVYGGLNKDGQKFAGIEDVAVGAEVIIKGKIKLYKETYEFDKNNELVSYIAPANDAISSIKAGKQQSIVDLSGRRVSKAVKGIYVVDGKKVVF